MHETGVFFQGNDRIELINGEITGNISPIGRKHAACINRLVTLFTKKIRRSRYSFQYKIQSV
jgi:hypothetical protein